MSWCEKHHVLNVSVFCSKRIWRVCDQGWDFICWWPTFGFGIYLIECCCRWPTIRSWERRTDETRNSIRDDSNSIISQKRDEGSSENCFQHLKMQFPTSLPSLLLRSWRFRGPWPCFLWGWVHHAALSVGLTLRQICTGKGTLKSSASQTKKYQTEPEQLEQLSCIASIYTLITVSRFFRLLNYTWGIILGSSSSLRWVRSSTRSAHTCALTGWAICHWCVSWATCVASRKHDSEHVAGYNMTYNSYQLLMFHIENSF